jgi:L-malate glycosyltransferase
MESLPTTVKEAFFLNIPVVATNVGGIPELITHDKTGILVPPDNPDKLADEINNLLFDKIKSEKLIENANIFLKNNMTWDVVLPKFINFYEKLLK